MPSKLPNQPRGNPKPEVEISGFSILLDTIRVMGARQNQSDNVSKKLQETSTKAQLKQNDSIIAQLDALTKSNEKLVDSLEKQTEIVKEDAQRAEIAEESIAEKEKEKIFAEETVAKKDEKDRAEIISKLSALERKNTNIVIEGAGFGGLGNLLSNLLELGLIAGGLLLAFNELKKFLDELVSGNWDPLSAKPGQASGAGVGAFAGNKAGGKAAPLTRAGHEKTKQGGKDMKAAASGNASDKGKPPPHSTPRDPKTGRFVKKSVPNMTPMQRAALGIQGAGKTALGSAQIVAGGARGLAATAMGVPSAAISGAAIGGVTAGIIASESGEGFLGTAKAGALGAGEGAGKAAALEVVAGLSRTGAEMAGSQLGAAAARAIPIAGWALLAYDLVKTAYSSGDIGRQVAQGHKLNELSSIYNDGLVVAEAHSKEAEKFKTSDPEKYDRMVEDANNMVRSNLSQLSSWMNIVDTEVALDKIIDLDKRFRYGPFGMWDRGEQYNFYDLETTMNDLLKVPGDGVTAKLKQINDNPGKYNVRGLDQLINTIGLEDTDLLLKRSPPILKKFRENINKDPEVYMKEKEPELQAAALTAKIAAKTSSIKENKAFKMKHGASLVESISPWGVPIMAGEQGNPETIIPLKKFDEVISAYLGQKDLNLQIDPKSYGDAMTNSIRSSYLEEKIQNSSAMTPIIINNNNTSGGGGEASGVNYQYQTDLSRTYENTFDMILEKNMRLGI